MSTPTDDEREALVTAAYGVINSHYWSTTGLPGMCAGCGYDIDAEPAGTMAEHRAEKLFEAGLLRRSEVPEPSDVLAERERAALHAQEGYRMGENCDDIAKRIRSGEPAAIGAPEPQGEPSDTEVLGEWFTSSHGVAVAAVAPMTDRGSSVMVDGRVLSPNDVAALMEFMAQGEPSDARSKHDERCEADWGAEGQESPCRCAERAQAPVSDALRAANDLLLAAYDANSRGDDAAFLRGHIKQAVPVIRAALRAAGVGGAR